MKKLIFRQKTRFGRTNLCVDEKTVELICETAKGHKWDGRIIPLEELSCDYERQRVVRYKHVMGWFLLAVLILWATQVAWLSVDPDISRVLFMVPSLGALYCLIHAVRESMPTELLLFPARNKQVAFGLVREKRYAQEFDAFVGELVSRIASAAHASRG